MDRLAQDLDALSIATWDRIYTGPALGISFREESITDLNLFTLRQAHPALKVRKFSWSEEVRNGGDWEWWIGSDHDGWLAIRVQAKKMHVGRYAELGYRAQREERIQAQVLVEGVADDAGGRALFAFYCFYNGWDASTGWPKGVPWTLGCTQPANCPTIPDVRVFGCALAPAVDIVRELSLPEASLDAVQYLPFQKPWSWLFNPRPDRSPPLSVAELLDVLVDLHPGESDGRPSLYEVLPSYARAVRDGWSRGALAEVVSEVRTDIVVVSEFSNVERDDAPPQ